MNSRERVRKALNHETSDRVPIDLGGSGVTGISASTLAHLRDALGLEPRPVKVWEPFQMLGDVEDDVAEAVGVDVMGIEKLVTSFGFPNINWQPWRFHGVDVLVSERFVTSEGENGDIFIHPRGDKSAPPSGRMPKNGFYFDAVVRQTPVDWNNLDPEEWVHSRFGIYPDMYLEYLRGEAGRLYRDTDYCLGGGVLGGGLGDISTVPAVGARNPRGICDPADWYLAHAAAPDFIKSVNEIQSEIALQNLELYRQAVGDKIDVIGVGGTDFGTQRGPLISIRTFRELYKPFFKKMNDWVHANTGWKTFLHSCGSIVAFIDDFIDMGVDILNPVQTSAEGMDMVMLKEKYGDKLVFWGGGVDTQHVLPFGTPQDVREDVRRRLEVFSRGGGYVFATIHNIQHGVPAQNLVAMFETVRDFASAPV
jgi:hypothetical protein